jgi:FkbM family methyltransferase
VFLVSHVIDLAERLLPPRAAFRLRLRRIDRWKTFEHGYHLLPMLVDPTRAAVDVGANEGFYAGKMARFTARVHCFEPLPWMADDLARKEPTNVVVHRAALSDHVGTTVLRIPYRGATVLHGTATIEPDNALDDAERVEEVACPVTTLDAAVGEPVGFVKIDVEGHELAVLRGAAGILDRDRPIVLVESERRHRAGAPEDVFAFLAERGYAGVALMDDKLFGLDGFAVAHHQAPTRHGRRYVNNFLFFPTLPAD